MDIRELDRRVLAALDPILAQVTVADLNRATPCTEWTLGDLLRHMVGHHRGFAAAAAGEPVGAEIWEGSTLGSVPYETYRSSASLVSQAFAVDGLLERTMVIHGYGTFTARTAIQMHAVDFLGHGWDVARSLGVENTLDDELCEHGLTIASRWPDTPPTRGPGGAFGPRCDAAAAASAQDRLMAFLGRDAAWTPPRPSVTSPSPAQ